MVCGSIGYGGVQEIRRLYSLLRTEGFDILDHITVEGMDYSDIKDFRKKKELSRNIVEHDLEYLKKADVVVVLSDSPSYGTAIEMFVAKNAKKMVISVAKDPVPSPWPVNFSDYIVTSEEELIKTLHEKEKE